MVTRDEQPWLLVEVKRTANHGLSKSLRYFQEVTGAEHALQLVFDADYVEADCFAEVRPMIAPMSTFLSQLI